VRKSYANPIGKRIISDGEMIGFERWGICWPGVNQMMDRNAAQESGKTIWKPIGKTHNNFILLIALARALNHRKGQGLGRSRAQQHESAEFQPGERRRRKYNTASRNIIAKKRISRF